MQPGIARWFRSRSPLPSERSCRRRTVRPLSSDKKRGLELPNGQTNVFSLFHLLILKKSSKMALVFENSSAGVRDLGGAKPVD